MTGLGLAPGSLRDPLLKLKSSASRPSIPTSPANRRGPDSSGTAGDDAPSLRALRISHSGFDLDPGIGFAALTCRRGGRVSGSMLKTAPTLHRHPPCPLTAPPIGKVTNERLTANLIGRSRQRAALGG